MSDDRDRVTAILDLAHKASRRPWQWHWRNDPDAPGSVSMVDQNWAIAMCPRYGKSDFAANAEYIVAACNAFPDVAAALLEALDTIDKAKVQHRREMGHCRTCDCPWPCPTWQALNGGNDA